MGLGRIGNFTFLDNPPLFCGQKCTHSVINGYNYTYETVSAAKHIYVRPVSGINVKMNFCYLWHISCRWAIYYTVVHKNILQDLATYSANVFNAKFIDECLAEVIFLMISRTRIIWKNGSKLIYLKNVLRRKNTEGCIYNIIHIW